MPYKTDTAAPAPSDGPAEESVANPATVTTIDLGGLDEEDREIMEEFHRDMERHRSGEDSADDASDEENEEDDPNELTRFEVPESEPMGPVEETIKFDRECGRGHLWPGEHEPGDDGETSGTSSQEPIGAEDPAAAPNGAFASDVPRFEDDVPDAIPNVDGEAQSTSSTAAADGVIAPRPLLDRIVIELFPAGGKQWLLKAKLEPEDGGKPRKVFHDELNPDKAKQRQAAGSEIAECVGEPPDGETAVALAGRILAAVDEVDEADEADDADAPAKNEADRVVAAAEPWIRRLFKDDGGTTYAALTLPTGLPDRPTREQAVEIEEEEFDLFLRRCVYEQTKGGVSDAALATAAGVFKARATFDGVVEKVFHRTGMVERDGEEVHYFDLGDDTGEAVETAVGGIRFVPDPPVNFVRPQGMLPVPRPTFGGSIKKLRRFLNVSHTGFMVVVAWLVMALLPKGRPFPILIVTGRQGAGKSSLVKALVGLVDACDSPLQRFPKHPDDLWLIAKWQRAVGLDNVRKVLKDWSDDICRILSGDNALRKRRHYSNGRMYVVDANNPMILAGIGGVANEPDLLDRSVAVKMNRIDRTKRNSEEKTAAAYEDLRAETLGCLLEGVQLWLKARRDGTLFEGDLPRMADFGQVARAAAPAFGFDPEAVQQAMDTSVAEVEAEMMETYPLVNAIAAAALEGSDVLKDLRVHPRDPSVLSAQPQKYFNKAFALMGVRSGRGLPPNASELSKQFKKCEGPLERMGITFEDRHPGHGRGFVIYVADWALPKREAVGSVSDVSDLPEEDANSEA